MSPPLARRVGRFAFVTGLVLVLTPCIALGARAPKPTGTAAAPAGPQAQEHVLSNGMKVVFAPRHLTPTVSAGWVAKVGSVNERPGITGISHLFEHMMFKGTHVIGTRDYAKDQALLEEQEKVQDEMRAEMSKLREAQRRGLIDDMTKPEHQSARYKELDAKFDALVKQQRENMVKNEFNQVLQKNGATFINAFTNNDQTFYFETVPANKLELWFWLEADRLKNPVFREFYSERDVVYEERRLRTESTPTGKFQVSFDAMFWDSSPYAWPVIGWPSDVANITKAQADEYYDTYYAPSNLTAILVGDFDPKEAIALAEKYLGSIPKGTKPVPEMITTETRQLAEKRFYGEAETSPAVEIRWHTPAFVHRDIPALEVLGEVLDGPSGRLNRSLVLKQGIATSAGSQHDPRKFEGMFELRAECKEGRTPEELEQALHAEVEKLVKEPVTAQELQSAKNRFLASTYRQVGSNQFVMFRYAISEGRATWQDLDRIERESQQVTAADIQRIAREYFTKENRAVAIWTRKGGAEVDPELAALPAEARKMVQEALPRITAAKDPAQLEAMLGRMDQMASMVPPEAKPAIEYMKVKIAKRLEELKAGGPAAASPTTDKN